MSKSELPTNLAEQLFDGDGSEDVNVIVTAAMPPSQDSGGGFSGPEDSAATGERLANVRGRVAPGSIINDKYVVEEVLGKGGMGIVLSARHVTLAERYAIKVLFVDGNTPGSDGGDFKRRFLQEARVSASLRGEHVARVFDVGELDEELLFMVMERVDGPSLSRVLKTQGTFPIRTAVEYVAQLCEGLAEAHARGIVHRDIKPMNVHLTTRADGSELIKILDFGIAKLRNDADKTKTGTLVGSVSHMAPEQLRSSSSVDERADVWSLGVILHQFLTGKPPLTGSMTTIVKKLLSDEPMPKLRDGGGDFPVALENAILQALSRDVSTRTQTVADFARDILTAAGFDDADERADLIGAALGRKGRREPRDAHTAYSSDDTRPSVTRKPAAKKRGWLVVPALLLAGGAAFVWWPRPHGTTSTALLPDPSAPAPILASGGAPASAPSTPASDPEPVGASSAAKHSAGGGGKTYGRPRPPAGGDSPPVVPPPAPAKPTEERPAPKKPANPFEERQ